jgi:hypothetical protein
MLLSSRRIHATAICAVIPGHGCILRLRSAPAALRLLSQTVAAGRHAAHEYPPCRYGRRQSVHRVRLRKPKRLPFLLARVSRTDGQRAYVCSGCHRWSRCVGPAGARRACRRLDGLSDRGGVSIGDRHRDGIRADPAPPIFAADRRARHSSHGYGSG